MMEPVILCLGGTAGVGKSTVARAVATRLDFAHHLATGYLRETLRLMDVDQTHPALFHPTFRPPTAAVLIEHFRIQSALVCRAVAACIQRSQQEGTHLVVEGNHLLPEHLHAIAGQHAVLLWAAPAAIATRVVGPTHRTRVITADDYAMILRIQDFLIDEATRWGIPCIENQDVDRTVQTILAGVPAVAAGNGWAPGRGLTPG
jgi:2-phosphoglycerate kinase